MATGVLLLRTTPRRAQAWARRGLVAARLTEFGRWTAVSLDGPDAARAAAPYDLATIALAARPVPRRMRPAIGFFDHDGTGVLTVQPAGLRRRHRWLIWRPSQGALRAEHLDAVVIAELAQATGVDRAALRQAISASAPTVRVWLAGLLAATDLPGDTLLSATAAGTAVEPSARSVRGFDVMVADDRAHQAELGEGS